MSARTQPSRRAEAERRLLDAAMALAADGGSRAITLAAVGERAGYSRGLVTHHFGSRRGLLDALTAELQERFAPPALPDRGLARLLALADAYLLELREHPLGTRVFLILWAEAHGAEPDLRPAFFARDARFRVQLEASLREGVADGEIRADVDPPALAAALLGQLRGTAFAMLQIDAEDVDGVREQAVALLAHGLRSG